MIAKLCSSFLGSLLLAGAFSVQAQVSAPAVHYSGLYGGSNDDHPRSILQTADSGFVMGGWAYSSDGEAASTYTTVNNAFVVRTDAKGNYLWSTVIAGSNYEYVNSLAIADGKIIVSGNSLSTDGDFAGMSGIKGFVAWLDSADGHLLRVRAFSGDMGGEVSQVKVLTGGFLLVTGYQTNSAGTSLPEGSNAWTALLNDTGKIIWQRFVEGKVDLTTRGVSVVHKMDGGYMMLAEARGLTPTTVIPGHHGASDFALVNMDETGKILWMKYYGGSGQDAPVSLVQTQDGGFICGGHTESTDGNVSGAHGNWDYWVFKTDKDGMLLWQKTFGGANFDLLFGLEGTCENGAIVYGHTFSTDGDAIDNTGIIDFLVLRLDAKGDTLWRHCYGSSQGDFEGAVTVTRDNGYAFAGTTGMVDRDVSGTLHGSGDYWLAVLEPDGLDNYCPLSTPAPVVLSIPQTTPEALGIRVYPNPVPDLLSIESKVPVHAALADIQGRVLLHSATGGMDLRGLASGLYLLTITDLEGHYIHAYKIQKSGNQ